MRPCENDKLATLVFNRSQGSKQQGSDKPSTSISKLLEVVDSQGLQAKAIVTILVATC